MLGINILAWFTFSFFCGSLPFSVWIGRWFFKVDIRQYGDKNPGTVNVFRAGGRGWAAVAMGLDFLKGALPVGLANWGGGVENWALALIAMAPVLGHAYSPLLGFHGGKALATTFGIWTGLTLWQGPAVLGITLAIGTGILAADGWAVLLGMSGLVVYLLLSQQPMATIAVGIANSGLLLWKYRYTLQHRPVLRKWIVKLINVQH